MTRAEFNKLEIGNYVQITQHGQNKGKIGKVANLWTYGLGLGGGAYLIPHDCEFNFSNPRQPKCY